MKVKFESDKVILNAKNSEIKIPVNYWKECWENKKCHPKQTSSKKSLVMEK